MINLKKLRTVKKISQMELSKQSGVAQSYISELEKGKYDCTVSVLCSLCKALDVTPNELIKNQYWEK